MDPRVQLIADEFKESSRNHALSMNRYEQGECPRSRNPCITSQNLLRKCQWQHKENEYWYQRVEEEYQYRQEEKRHLRLHEEEINDREKLRRIDTVHSLSIVGIKV